MLSNASPTTFWLEAHEHRQDPGENGRRIENFIGENEHLSQIIGGRPVYCQNLINGGRRGKVTSRYDLEIWGSLVCTISRDPKPCSAVSPHIARRAERPSRFRLVIVGRLVITPMTESSVHSNIVQDLPLSLVRILGDWCVKDVSSY